MRFLVENYPYDMLSRTFFPTPHTALRYVTNYLESTGRYQIDSFLT